MRRLLLTFSVALACMALAQPVDAQVKFGAQASVMTGLEDLSGTTMENFDLNGTFGLGGRVAFQPPLLPVGAVAQGVYYFPSGDDFSYMTYSLAAQLRLPLPVVSPYAIGGWQWRRSSVADFPSTTESGPMVGVGVQLNLGVSLFLEGGFEFNDEVSTAPDFDNNPIVIQGGILFGN